MTDGECIEFLQWALPRLAFRWPGFRKVRRQVHKRIARRIAELGLTTIGDYREYLRQQPEEWTTLDSFCRISISRFYRDRDVFQHVRDVLLPDAARLAEVNDHPQVRVWSAGCASGEEPYTLAILWRRHVQTAFPWLELRLLATDADEQILERAGEARYPASSLKDAPAVWREAAFTRSGDEYVLRPEFRAAVEFRRQDLRDAPPAGEFQLILCRNLAFTYFAEPLQRQVAKRFAACLAPGGMLLVGKHESLPPDVPQLEPHAPQLGVHRRAEPPT